MLSITLTLSYSIVRYLSLFLNPISELKQVQNMATCLISDVSHRDHIQPVFHDLLWLLIFLDRVMGVGIDLKSAKYLRVCLLERPLFFLYHTTEVEISRGMLTRHALDVNMSGLLAGYSM